MADTSLDTAERLRVAEGVVAGLRTALDKAETGLHAAGAVVDVAATSRDQLTKKRRITPALIVAAVAALVWFARRRSKMAPNSEDDQAESRPVSDESSTDETLRYGHDTRDA